MRTALCSILLVFTGGCATMQPAEFFQLPEESPAYKSMESRIFETANGKELLSASAAVFQDLGFQVEDIVSEMGFIRAAKERSAREYGQDISRFFLFVLSFGHLIQPIDLQQKISATLVTRPLTGSTARYEVRVIFYRVVWKGHGLAGRDGIPPGEQRMEMIRDPLIYQQFFVKLSKAVFLEAFTL